MQAGDDADARIALDIALCGAPNDVEGVALDVSHPRQADISLSFFCCSEMTPCCGRTNVPKDSLRFGPLSQDCATSVGASLSRQMKDAAAQGKYHVGKG